MKKDLYEEKISSEMIFKGKILNLFLDKVRLPNKKIATREKVTHPGAVGIIPFNKDGKVMLVKQYRYPVGEVLMEIPAGKIDKNETPVECARRELKEEIGGIGGELIYLISFYSSPGFCDEKMHLYLAVDFDIGKNSLEDDEFLNIVELKMREVMAYIKNGELKDAKTIIGILTAQDYLIKNKSKIWKKQ